MFKKFLKDNSGTTAIEYALIIALIAIVTIPAIQYVGQEVKCTFEKTAATLQVANGGGSTAGRCGANAGTNNNSGGGHGEHEDDHDNGHGNDDDHDDDSNPGKGKGNHGTK